MAGTGDWSRIPRAGSLNAEILSQGYIAASHAAYLARRDVHIAAGVRSLVANVIGTGIVPRSLHPEQAVRDRLRVLWNTFAEETNIYLQQQIAFRMMVEAGECFALLRLMPARNRTRAVPLRVTLIDPQQVPLDLLSLLTGNSRIRGGIEYDDEGNVVAYHVLPVRQDDPLAAVSGAWNPVRLPASDVAHLFELIVPGQIRGVSRLIPLLWRSYNLRGV